MINGVKCRRKIKKSKTSDLLLTDSSDGVIVNCKKSGFSGMILSISRLERVQKIVRSKKFSQTIFDNTFSKFR